MPKVKWVKPPKRVNVLKMLFQNYQKAQGLSSAQLGEKLNLSAEAVRAKYFRGKWNSEEIRRWCQVLNITDPAELGKALLY